MTVAGAGEQSAETAGTGIAVSFGGPGPVRLRPLIEWPLVSVLIANRDCGRLLSQALDRLLVQSYDHWEATVCDDGSTDGSRAAVRVYSKRDPRISLVNHAVNRGRGGQPSICIRYPVAIVLPSGMRAQWVGASLSASRPKEILGRAWRFVGGG
jgi:hypothetical protein